MSTGINWSNITVDNGAIRDLRELIMLETLEGGDFAQFHDVMTGVVNGEKLAGVGEFAEVGTPDGTSCTPTYNSSQARSVEKEWVIKEWVVAEKICYKDIDATAARSGLKAGTEIADVTGTLISDILTPLIEKAIKRMFWRLAWFGDTAALNVSGGGVITNGKDTALFTNCDGYFKRLAVIYTATPARKVAIAANSEATFALQFSELDNAVEIFDALIYGAKIELRNMSDKFIMCTRSLTDAYQKELTKAPNYTEIQWQTGMDGMQFFRRGGVDIYPIDLWDKYIQEYQSNGTKWNSPHRAVFTFKNNLKFGVASTELLASLDIWFSKDDQDVKMLAKDKCGTLIFDDTLVEVAI